jgi:glutamyl-tRNA synthetase
LDELIEKFSIERVNKSGAKFDFEKAKWFNAEWIKKSEVGSLKPEVIKVFADKGVVVNDDEYLAKVIGLIKDRCVLLLSDFYQQAGYFFEQPAEYDLNAVKPKWTDAKTDFFNTLSRFIK